MKIYDLFSFSEPYEKELLLLKLKLGDPLVHEWWLVENDYTLRSSFKGYFAEDVIASDERFEPFRKKIRIFKCSYIHDKPILDDYDAIEVEYFQRDSVTQHVKDVCGPDDYIIISDVDECPDFTNEKRKKEFSDKLNHGRDVIELPTKRFWFDFDNEYKIVLSTPVIKAAAVFSGTSISQTRKKYRRPCNEKWKNYIVFEYSHCFDKMHLHRKLGTFAHMGLTEHQLDIALENNHRILTGREGDNLQLNEKYLFETIRLNKKNSPSIVSNNLDIFKVGIINENYKQNRKLNYPGLFTAWNVFCYQTKLFFKKLMLAGSVT